MGLYKDFVSQTRKPVGFLGKVMVARMISEKHELLKDFLLQTTGTDEKAAEEEACRMEHFVSRATLDGIRDFIQKNRPDATT